MSFKISSFRDGLFQSVHPVAIAQAESSFLAVKTHKTRKTHGKLLGL